MNKDKEILIIKNFGPIKDIKLDLKKINILIGKQATGKSTVAKVLAVCRYFSYIYDYKIIQNYETVFKDGLEYWNIDSYTRDNTLIFYENKHYSIEIRSEKTHEFVDNDKNGNPIFIEIDNNLNLNLVQKSDEFKSLVKELEENKPTSGSIFKTNFEWQPSETFFSKIKNIMNNPFFLPAERGLQSIFSLGRRPDYSESLYNQLASIYNISNKFIIETDIEFLDIVYKNEKGKGYVKKKKENSFYTLSNGASGYQSGVPIVLTVEHYNLRNRKNKTFIVEEPEINLFPSAQKKLMAFFIKNVNKNGHSFVIPTHSPYFLSAINDYLMAYKKGQLNKKETKKIIKEEYWLNIDDISCYQLKNGKAKSIIDKKTGLISDNIIDEVSDDMNDEFENLLDIR